MAVIIQGFTKCAICNGDLNQPYTATSGCAFEEHHSLFKYCDAPLHLSCLEQWPSRQEFSKAYFDLAKEDAMQRPAGLLLDEGFWILRCGPAARGEKPYYVEARRQDWPFCLYSHWEEWERFLEEEYAACLEGMALEAATEVIEVLRIRLSSQAALNELYETKRAS